MAIGHFCIPIHKIDTILLFARSTHTAYLCLKKWTKHYKLQLAK